MGGGWSTPRPGRFTPRKDPVLIVSRLGGPQSQSERMRKISISPGFDPRTVQPVASRYTDWTGGADSRSPVLWNVFTLFVPSLYQSTRYRHMQMTVQKYTSLVLVRREGRSSSSLLALMREAITVNYVEQVVQLYYYIGWRFLSTCSARDPQINRKYRLPHKLGDHDIPAVHKTVPAAGYGEAYTCVVQYN